MVRGELSDMLLAAALQYNESFQKVSAEREQIAAQYQQYIDQLTLQSQQLNAQVTLLTLLTRLTLAM